MSLGRPPEAEIYELLNEFNNRPDHLVAIVKHRLQTPGNLGYLHLAQIDPEGRWAKLFYHPPPLHPEIELKIPFDPPVKNNADIKAQMFNWRAEAIQHFRPPATPIVKYYSPPALFPFTLPLAILELILLYALLGWGQYADLFRAKVESMLGKHIIPAGAIFAGIMHFLVEPAMIASQLRKHQTPFSDAWKWVLTVVAVGYAGLNEWAECLEHERIRYIYSKTDVGETPPRVKAAVTKEKKDL